MPKSSIELALLLVWLSCCAVYLAVARTFLLAGPQDLPQVLLLSLLAGLHGTCWAGLLATLWIVFGNGRRELEPGVWLMFSLGLVLTAELVVGALPDDFTIRKEALTIAVSAIAFALPTLSRRISKWWKLTFVALLLVSIWPLIDVVRQMPVVSPAHTRWVVMGVIPFLCVPIIRDYQLGIRRSWLHWIGVVCLVVWAVPLASLD